MNNAYQRQKGGKKEKGKQSHRFVGSKLKKKRFNALSEYVGGKGFIHGHLDAYQKQQMRRQEQENMRLVRKLSEISKRKNTFSNHKRQEQYNRFSTLNMRSRQMERERKTKEMQYENQIIVDKIIRTKKHSHLIRNTSPELSNSRSRRRRKRRNKSLVLPIIDEQPVGS